MDEVFVQLLIACAKDKAAQGDWYAVNEIGKVLALARRLYDLASDSSVLTGLYAWRRASGLSKPYKPCNHKVDNGVRQHKEGYVPLTQDLLDENWLTHTPSRQNARVKP